ncbi:MAG: undecaprenyl-phosphate glucose phosphotransferase [Chloroflexota bacterium]
MTREKARSILSASLVLMDIAAIVVAFVSAFLLRRYIPLPNPAEDMIFREYVPLLVVQVASILVTFFITRLYHVGRSVSRVDQFYSIFGGVSVGSLVAIAVASFLFKNQLFDFDYSRAMIIYAWVLDILLVNSGRSFHQYLRMVMQSRGVLRDRVLVVGSGQTASMVLQKIAFSPHLGYELAGVVTSDQGLENVADVPVAGAIDDLPDLITDQEVDEVIIAMPQASHEEIIRIISLCERGRIAIKVYPDLFQIMASQVSIDHLGGLPLISVRDVALRGWKLTLKRGIDLVLSAVGLVVLSPLMLLVAILVRLESPGSVFYIQTRMGLDAKPFDVIKFRSMRQDAEKDGPGWTTEDDPRKTRIGNLIRKLNIDELPQLINVLIGEMSLVGPRPERPVYVQQFRQSIPRYMDRHREKAGLTGWAQVNGLRGDTSILERTKYDLWYTENWSIWLDFSIMIRTIVQAIVLRSKAY